MEVYKEEIGFLFQACRALKNSKIGLMAIIHERYTLDFGQAREAQLYQR